METVELQATLRTPAGTSGARSLRREGKIPATCYGRAMEPMSVAIVPSELSKALGGSLGANAPVTLCVDNGKKLLVMLQDHQRHPITRRLMHADFRVIDPKEEVVVTVPFKLVGRSKGVVIGGSLRQITREVKVRCLPEAIPAELTFDVTEMDIKSRAMLSQVQPPEGVKVVFKQDMLICQVLVARVVGPEEGGKPAAEGEAKPAAAAPAAEGKKDEKAKK